MNLLVNKINYNFLLVFAIFFVGFPVRCFAETKEICALLKSENYVAYSGEKHPAVMYLVDQFGNVNKGPVDFGEYTYVYKERDFFLIPTNYRLIVFPKKIILENSGQGIMGESIVLKPSKDVCPNSRTYTISYQEREVRNKENSISYINKMPFKISSSIEPLRFLDSGIDVGDADVYPKCRFDCRIVGTIVDGRKN